MSDSASISLEEKIARVLAERIVVVPYNPEWPKLFDEEMAHLGACLPEGIIRRVEHFGSTSVPGLAAKPIVDMLVEVSSLEAVRRQVAPLLEAQGYDYFWRPTFGNEGPPWYAWFIRRDASGARTHHIHMVEATPEFARHWERLAFRDYLRAHPDFAGEYAQIKERLAQEFPHERVEYTVRKGLFISRVTKMALAEQAALRANA